MSPFLFAVYVDDLIERLRASGSGIDIGSLFYGCILYADDIVLLSSSCHGLQKLLDMCGNYGIEWDIKFNRQERCLYIRWEEPINWKCAIFL